MKRLTLYIYSLILLAPLLFLSCKKENTTYSEVRIIAPEDGSSFGFGDTLRVGLEVTRSEGDIAVDLMDGNRVIKVSNHLVYEQGSYIEYEFYFTDHYLTSGNYDIRVLAYNGENRSADFVKISYQELPLRFRGLVVLTQQSPSEHAITSYDSASNAITVLVNGEYNDLAANSFQQVVAVAPEMDGRLQGFKFPNLETRYDIASPVGPGLKQYEHAFSAGEYIYFVETQGQIKGLNGIGNIARSYSTPVNYEPQSGCIGAPGMLLSAQLEGTSQYMLFLLNSQNGAVLKKASLPGRVVEMAYAGENRFVVVYESNGNAVITIYKSDLNELTTYRVLQGEQALSLLRVNDRHFLVSTSVNVLRFDPYLPQIPTVVHSFAAVDMVYDETSDIVYYASGNSVFSGPVGAVPNLLYTPTGSLQKIEIVYNK